MLARNDEEESDGRVQNDGREDVGVTGYAGKHSGATGSVKAKWAF